MALTNPFNLSAKMWPLIKVDSLPKKVWKLPDHISIFLMRSLVGVSISIMSSHLSSSPERRIWQNLSLLCAFFRSIFPPLFLVNTIFAGQQLCVNSIIQLFWAKLLGHFYGLCSGANLWIKSGFMPRIIQSLPAPSHSRRPTFQGLISCKFYSGASFQSQIKGE